MLRFSANLSLLFSEYSWLERFQAAKDYGFQAVEIQFPYNLPAEQLQIVLFETGLKLVQFNIAADDLMQGGEGLACVPGKQHLFKEAVGEALSYARILKPEVINVLPGRCLNPQKLDEYRQTFTSNLRYATNQFSSFGIRTVFEAINTHDMPNFIVSGSRSMLEIQAEANSPSLGLQYDIYHMTMMGEDCQSFLTQHIDKIAHIQFADCPGRGQPGSGAVDFQVLFDIIANSSYQGWVGAEYKPTGATTASLGWLTT